MGAKKTFERPEQIIDRAMDVVCQIEPVIRYVVEFDPQASPGVTLTIWLQNGSKTVLSASFFELVATKNHTLIKVILEALGWRKETSGGTAP